MARADKTIVVDVPIGMAYKQWTSFEDYPHFMDGVEKVIRLDGERLCWVSRNKGDRKETRVRIVRQVLNRVLAWESESDDANNGTVVFRSVSPGRTEVQLHLDYVANDVREQLGDARVEVQNRIEANLRRFKAFVEGRPGNGA